MTTNLPVQVEIALAAARKIKHLRKKYPHVADDVLGLIEQLERGDTPGDQVQGVKHVVYKVRVKNTDVPKGKSGGYRVVYYIRTSVHVILIAIYSKTEQSDIAPHEVRRLIEALDLPGS